MGKANVITTEKGKQRGEGFERGKPECKRQKRVKSQCDEVMSR